MSVCFASARSVICFLGGVFVPLRGGLSENVLSKGKKNDSRHLGQRSGGVSANERNNNFSGNDIRVRNHTVPAAQVR